MNEFIRVVCEERHQTLNKVIDDLSTAMTKSVERIDKMFLKIMLGIFTTLLTVIGTLIVFIIKR